MSTPLLNEFSSFQLSEVELLTGQILTIPNIQFLQNIKSEIAHQILGLRFDPEHPQQFVQENAELQGKLGILNYLLECNDSAQAVLRSGQNNQEVDLDVRPNSIF